MKALSYIVLICVIATFSYGQEYEFDIHHKKLMDAVNAEEKLGSKSLKNSARHLVPKGVAQPISFRRKQSNIPDLFVQYFYYQKDSVLHYILYEWDESNYVDYRENDKKSKSFQQHLIEKYTSLQQLIGKEYGEGKSEGSLTELSKIKERSGLERSDVWHPNDSTEIELSATLSNFYEKKGMLTINPTHRIRLYVRNTKEKAPVSPTLTQARIDTLNNVAQELFGVLASKKFEYTKQFLSELIIGKVSNEQLEMLSSKVDFTQKMDIYFSGVQVGVDGNVFTILQYKQSSETSTPPKELLKVVFDGKGKIAGIQPMKRG